VRSDSLSALSSILKESSRSRNLNNIVAEILLDEAELYNSLAVVVHILGIKNIQPNAMSRLSTSSPSTIPQALRSVPRLQLPPRDDSFWPAQGPERKEAQQIRKRSAHHHAEQLPRLVAEGVSTIASTPLTSEHKSQTV
jgi:hypothetical protein